MLNHRVLIVGGTGSLGRKLIQRWLPLNEVAVYSRDEAKHWTIKNDLSVGPLATSLGSLRFYVGDVRDRSRVQDVLRQYEPNVIIIAAALKQVDTCELTPDESVKTNLTGTQNVIDAVNADCQSHLERATVLFVSTDKACSPVNVYGMCKAVSERIVTSQAKTCVRPVRYLATRYGNVLESRGSIVPLFKHQGMHSKFLTVTDPDMTRYCMTLDDSVDLIERALERGVSGETRIPRLPSMRIGDLASIFARKYSKPIRIIGDRPGEKRHESLINESESSRTYLSDDNKDYVIKPAYEQGTWDKWTYSSDQDVMNKIELEAYLASVGVLDAPLESFKGAHIEEIVTNRKV